jgi:6-phosphogluconolactonase
MHGEVQVVASVPDAFARLFVHTFAHRSDPRLTVFLSGGPTARACYERLADVAGSNVADASDPPPTAETVDWTAVDFYWGDERCVAPDDDDANQRLGREALLDRVAPVGSVHPMTDGGDPEASARSYQKLIAPLETIDMIHLGMGPDGHTASLFPGADTLDAGPEDLVAATSDPEGRNPHPRLTITFPVMTRARLIVFTVSGETKQSAFACLAAGADLPAARVRPAPGGRVVWLVDPDAAGTTGIRQSP